jgi:bifunctional UDP-N-acetylglucosamine pyrophosphorylase / glucosamine-1-phosphate N-acetyltransferase
VILGSTIGRDVAVGPFVRMRPGVEMADGSKAGAFVDLKAARVGRGTKVPHLSYVGDATVGEGTNLGCGTITANYDGEHKHRTTIGSHVRSASNTVYVAPVRIGDGAYTGAGAVVRKDVPAGALALTVAPQRNIEGWVVEHRPGSRSAEAARAAAEESGA